MSKRPVDGQAADHGDGTDHRALQDRERARLVLPWDAYER